MSDDTTTLDPETVLRAHDTHVFVFTSAGKPIFSLHGDPNAFASLFAVLRVLMQMCSERAVLGSTQNNSITNSNGGGGALQYIRCGPAGLALYFLAKDELCCVLATRRHAAPALAQYCAVQLNYVHRLIFAMVPNVRAVLACEPSRDAWALFSQADMDVLRDLVVDDARNDSEENVVIVSSSSSSREEHGQYVAGALPHMTSALCRLFHALPSGALRPLHREWLEELLLRAYQRVLLKSQPSEASTRAHDEEEDGENALPLTVWLVYRDVIVAAVGPHEARQPVAYLNASCSTNNSSSSSSSKAGQSLSPLTPRQREDARQSAQYALSVSDAHILLHFAYCLRTRRRQRGEAWAPLCLWDFNKTGYVWVYVASLQEHLLQGGMSATSTTTTTTVASEDDDGLYVVQVSCSQHNFLALSRLAQGVAEGVRRDYARYTALLAELRAPVLLYPVTSAPQPSCTTNTTNTIVTEGVPCDVCEMRWAACVMRGQVAPHVVTLPSVVLSGALSYTNASCTYSCEGRMAALWSRLQAMASHDMPLVMEHYVSECDDDACTCLALCPSAKVLQLLYEAELSCVQPPAEQDDDDEQVMSHRTVDRLHSVLARSVYALLVAFPAHLPKARVLAACHGLLLRIARGVQEPTTLLVRQRRIGMRA